MRKVGERGWGFMSGTKIKICGLFRPEDIEYANRIGPDYVGFILSPGFRRSITREQAAEFRRKLSAQIPAAGVFVNAPCEEILAFLEENIIQTVQLHGNETEEEIRMLQAAGKPVIKAVKVQCRRDVEERLDSSADYLLFDSGTGTGRVFDWKLLAGIHRPYFLAGGLHIGNLAEALKTLHPYGVDLSSGVETEGRKDEEKMRRAVELVRGFG